METNLIEQNQQNSNVEKNENTENVFIHLITKEEYYKKLEESGFLENIDNASKEKYRIEIDRKFETGDREDLETINFVYSDFLFEFNDFGTSYTEVLLSISLDRRHKYVCDMLNTVVYK